MCEINGVHQNFVEILYITKIQMNRLGSYEINWIHTNSIEICIKNMMMYDSIWTWWSCMSMYEYISICKNTCEIKRTHQNSVELLYISKDLQKSFGFIRNQFDSYEFDGHLYQYVWICMHMVWFYMNIMILHEYVRRCKNIYEYVWNQWDSWEFCRNLADFITRFIEIFWAHTKSMEGIRIR